MVARNALLMLLLAAASGGLRADTVRCVLEAKVTYPTAGGAPVPVCSSQCASSESGLYYHGTSYHRFPELTANYQLMVKAVYQYGALTSCTLVPYQTTAQLAALPSVYHNNVDACNAAYAAQTTTEAPTTTAEVTTETTPETTTTEATTPEITTDKTTPETTTTTKTTPETTTTTKTTTTTTTTTTPAPVPVYSCPTGYKMYSNTKCYKVNTYHKNWWQARDSCVAEGSYLATFGSMDELNFAGRLITANAWIGLNDLAKFSNFVYTNGSPVTFSYWYPGEPNNLNYEHCVEMYNANYHWNDKNCETYSPFVCERLVSVTYV